ncbi:MAG: hypothetical protein HYY32_01445 [Chloroflexi bacterium]|nr:hypothetical protein [Chloroflexota bacterium]
MVSAAFGQAGFSFDAAQREFPIEMFLPGSDLTPLEENIEKIVDGLTRWSAAPQKVTRTSDKLEIEAEDYPQAAARMNSLFLRNKWGDGLPLVPPTEDNVRWILTGTDLAPGTLLGKMPPSGRLVTVEAAAIALAMTGGRPEYMPVLIAAEQGLTDPLLRPEMTQTTTCSVFIGVVVSGPVAKQIRLNSGYGCLGPDPSHPAGASIGRAMRLMQQDVGGAVPGSGTMATFGGPARYANVVFAEDEDGLPADWEPLSVERGFRAGSNIATVHALASATNISTTQASTEDVALQTLDKFVRIMGADYGNVFTHYSEKSVPGIALVPREIARGLSANGWSKGKVKAYLWENTKVPLAAVKSDTLLYRRASDTMKAFAGPDGAWPLAAGPDNMMLVVAGGEQSGHCYWMRVGCCPIAPVSKRIALPANWAQLLDKAEEDLGAH